MAERFIIRKNRFLMKNTIGYYNCEYVRYGQPGNPDFLNKLKNIYGNENISVLKSSMKNAAVLLEEDIPDIIEENDLNNCALICVPRSKAWFTAKQLMFKEAVRMAAVNMNIIDGTDYIIRTDDTYTTHFRNPIPNFDNDGDKPYPGITKETCVIDSEKIYNKNIILIDDIYTNGVNIDEDCIQALTDAGAKNIILYVIAYTR